MQQGNKWESSTDVTSIPGSSPPRSPALNPARTSSSDRPNKQQRQNPNSFYYVQSPSQFDGDSLYNKSSLSLQSSPTASPRHHLDYTSRRGKSGGKGSGSRPPRSTTCTVINEEDGGLYPPSHPYQHPADHLSARIRLFIFFLIFCGALLGLLILLIWVTMKPSAPQVFIKNVVFHDVYIGAGEDASGVPTNLITINCTVQIDFINTSKHLKAHLHPLQTELLYSKLSVAIQKTEYLDKVKYTMEKGIAYRMVDHVSIYGYTMALDWRTSFQEKPLIKIMCIRGIVFLNAIHTCLKDEMSSYLPKLYEREISHALTMRQTLRMLVLDLREVS